MPINLVVFDLSSYLPDSLVPQYETLRDAVVSFLETIGIAKGIESASAGEFTIQVIVLCQKLITIHRYLKSAECIPTS